MASKSKKLASDSSDSSSAEEEQPKVDNSKNKRKAEEKANTEEKVQPKKHKVDTKKKDTKKPAKKDGEKKKSSSESSESDSASEEEPKKPELKKGDTKKPETKKQAPVETKKAEKTKKKEEEDGSASEDSEEEPKKTKETKKQAPVETKKPEKNKKEDEDDEESSSSEDSEAEPKKQTEKKQDTKKQETHKPTENGNSSPSAGGVTRVYVGNLSFKIDDQTIKDFFKDCGEIKEIDWVNNKEGRFSGTGFLEFASPEAAQKAVKKNGEECMERKIKAEFAKPRADRGGAKRGGGGRNADFELSPKPEGCITVFVGKLSYDIDEETMRDTFKDCGDIKEIRWLNDRETGQFKGCAFVEFSSTGAVDKAVKLNGSSVMGRAMKIDFASNKRN